jgi:hypothetical protein
MRATTRLHLPLRMKSQDKGEDEKEEQTGTGDEAEPDEMPALESDEEDYDIGMGRTVVHRWLRQ